MKVAPVSADLLIKLALAGLAVGVAVYAARRVGSLGASVYDAVTEAADTVGESLNPLSDRNLAYRAANAVGTVLTDGNPTAPGMNADGSWSLGGWLYDVTH